MLDPWNTDPKRDVPDDRPVAEENGNAYRVVRRPEDPYGMWTIHRDAGQIPPELKGKYTTPKLAEQAVIAYIQKKNRCLVKPPSKSKTTSEAASLQKPRD